MKRNQVVTIQDPSLFIPEALGLSPFPLFPLLYHSTLHPPSSMLTFPPLLCSRCVFRVKGQSQPISLLLLGPLALCATDSAFDLLIPHGFITQVVISVRAYQGLPKQVVPSLTAPRELGTKAVFKKSG